MRKAADSNGTVLPAHPLATEPGTPVRIAFHSAEPRIRTAILLVLSEAPLPVGLVRHAPQRACSGIRTPAASVPGRRAYRCHKAGVNVSACFLVCSAGVEPATDDYSSRPLYLGWSTSTGSRRPVPTRAVRCTKAEPQPCAAAWLPGLDSNQRRRGPGPRWGHLRPTRKRCGRRDSNAQTARSELARSPNCHHSRVRRPGIEPGVPRLRVECFTDIARGACDAG